MLNNIQIRNAMRRIMPDRQALTLMSRRSGDNQTSFFSYTIPEGRLKQLTKEDIELFDLGPGSHRYRIIQVWKRSLEAATAIDPAVLPCPVPKATDQIIGAREPSATWIVEQVKVNMMGEVYNCLCERTV